LNPCGTDVPRALKGEALTTINWTLIRGDFINYLASESYSEGYKGNLLRYLDKYFTVLSSPADIMRLFAKVEKGKRHLWLGFRTIFNFLEATGYDPATLTIYRKALPTFHCGIDLNVPEAPIMLKALSTLKNARPEYKALYNLLIDSGLRLIEAVKAMGEIESAEAINSFYRLTLGEFRGSKQAYYCYLTKATYDQIIALKAEQLHDRHATSYYCRLKVTRPKYVRKFAFDTMIVFEVRESVADFIEGRVPKKIGAKHYMVLIRQADKFYGKYAKYLTELRASVT
jgi:intergrase/recombinase